MIRTDDLRQAITECQAERNPNAHTCMKLAAFLTILDHLEDGEGPPAQNAVQPVRYSFADAPTTENTILYNSGTEFGSAVNGKKPDDVWPVLDELLEVLTATHPRLYAATIRKLEEL